MDWSFFFFFFTNYWIGFIVEYWICKNKHKG